MTHPLVLQLRFTRSEFRRALAGLTDADAGQRVGPMNSIAWNIGHLAWQEQRYWLTFMQGQVLLPELNEKFRYGCPPYTPPLAEAWSAWETVTAAADPFLDTLTTETLLAQPVYRGEPLGTSAGSLMQRVIYHYWYHIGESMGVRQALGHTGLPDFVGDIDTEAPYRPD